MNKEDLEVIGNINTNNMFASESNFLIELKNLMIKYETTKIDVALVISNFTQQESEK